MTEQKQASEAARRAATLAPHATFVRLTLILAELFADNFREASILADEVSHLFEDRWRMKFLQLGIETGIGEKYAMESCVRAAARTAPVNLGLWSMNWRHDALGIDVGDLRPHKFAAGTPVPISGRQTQLLDSVIVRQTDRSQEIGDSGVSWVPQLIVSKPARDAPDYFSDLNTLILACAAASWLPIALHNHGWSYIGRPVLTEETVLLLQDGRMFEVGKR
jgi:hypothetical protein